ncbi:DUF885 domain-containing protein [Thalassomonas actiniarum]|uniref:DUF885 domain-containing protein n=1 Tax=Thalassomonas actiniarum TaxID=485447 RepID=A0AAE9YN13_9GAMM|nr:DUF885 domain-containing protein [Thalassomonas actiniarum]WDD97980.1 DUF885 domain-containing protein [Thalassomonas actiniarum]
MSFNKSLLSLALSAGILSGCSVDSTSQSTAAESVAQNTQNMAEKLSESEKANKLFDAIFMEEVNRNPLYQTYIGLKTNYDKWHDLSEENAYKELEFTKKDLARIQALDTDKLDAQTRLNYQLLEQELKDTISDFKWRHHNYPVNQMHGIHAQLPAVMINMHSIDNTQQARDYISRLHGTEKLLKQLIEQLRIREHKGIIPPKFVFGHVIRDSKNLLTGAPFDNSAPSILLNDFTGKVNKLDISEQEKAALIKDANNALLTGYQSGYQALIDYLVKLESKADTRDGAWKLPDGESFYNRALQNTTTTDLTASEIHQIGLNEVKRIHQEMSVIMKKVGFKGTLNEFFDFMRHDPQFYYANDEAGRSRYLKEATAIIDNMKTELDKLFIKLPKADLVVKKVEAFREKSAGKAFYQQPAPDGSRPGYYYANLYDMAAMPVYQMEALAFHEGIPGHHMQNALKLEQEDMPMFRKFGDYTAYGEGWGLYSEFLPKEIGFYQDPYSDFGRLAMELWRACRLVVDTGIHEKKWTRAQGIEYYASNTPNAQSDVIKMVERHVVMPSQATAYKIGMLKILELREKAKQALGNKFDIREFHDVVLSRGELPLNVLETMIDNYISDRQAKA